MRRLRIRFGGWVKNRLGAHDERGAVLAFVAVGLVMLIGFTAFSVDYGRIYSERRELQSGADAAALAVAYDCAFGGCDGAYDEYAVAEQYADANASDDLAWVDDMELNLGQKYVRVHTATEEAGGDHNFDMMFAQVLGFDGFTVGAEARVAWGSPKSLATLPIIFSICEWEKFASETQPASAVLNNELAPTPGYPVAPSTIFFHGKAEECHYSPSGQDLPGGFGWLDTDGTCVAELDDEGWVYIDPGASPSTGCTASVMEGLVGTVVLIPYFDEFIGTGSGAQYHVAGFGALYVTGYNFAGLYKWDSEYSGLPVCTGEDRCIEGYFIEDWVAEDDGGELGGADFGVVIVKFEA